MKPADIAKGGSEHAHQAAFFAYCAVAREHGFEVADAWAEGEGLEAAKSRYSNRVSVPALQWIHAIHNQGHGDQIRGGKAKAEGVKAGVSDIFLPWPLTYGYEFNKNSGSQVAYCGLYIEMKKPSEKPKSATAKGGLSDKQKEFGEYAKSVGYGFVVCYSWQEAVEQVKSYINWEG